MCWEAIVDRRSLLLGILASVLGLFGQKSVSRDLSPTPVKIYRGGKLSEVVWLESGISWRVEEADIDWAAEFDRIIEEWSAKP